MSTPIEIKVPDLGGAANVPVIDVLVKDGDSVEVETPLITIETEKATMDVPSPAAGKVVALKVGKGSKVGQGSVILLLEPASGGGAAVSKDVSQGDKPQDNKSQEKTAGYEPTIRQPALQMPAGTSKESPPAAAAAASPATAAPAAAVEPAAKPAPAPAASSVATADFSTAYAGPFVRKLARELGVDLLRVKGTGPKGRITPDDVKAFVKQTLTAAKTAPAAAAAGGSGLPKVPDIDFSKFGPVEVKPLGRIQKISGTHLQTSWLNVPHVWQTDEADITDLEEARNKLKQKAAQEGVKLTPLAFILRACVKALQEFPAVNSSLDGTGKNLVWKKFINLGFAADTPNGLVVPVIRDADKKDVYELAKDLAALSEKARIGKLTAADMQGGCFTVSSLGGIGGSFFTPIINVPEVAILGVAKSSMKPVYQNGSFVPRLILPFTLAYDHRVVDGALGVRFTTFLAQKLADVRGLLEAIP